MINKTLYAIYNPNVGGWLNLDSNSWSKYLTTSSLHDSQLYMLFKKDNTMVGSELQTFSLSQVS